MMKEFPHNRVRQQPCNGTSNAGMETRGPREGRSKGVAACGKKGKANREGALNILHQKSYRSKAMKLN